MEEQPHVTIDDFLHEHPCAMTVERAGATPSTDKERFDFRCTITEHSTGPRHTVRQAITVEYHMGIGHAWEKAVRWPTPDLRDVIDSLRLDAQSIDNGETFIEFAREMGYQSLDEYEEARKAYDGCHESLAMLRRLFGRAETERLLYEVEGR